MKVDDSRLRLTRQLLILGGACAASVGLVEMRPLEAAVLAGRVVDSAAQPVAAAEVRIWQKLRQEPGQGAANKQLKFDGSDVVITDAEGRFATPDVLVGEAFARLVAEADGMLAGRSGWIEVGNAAKVAVPDIVLKRLRAVRGKVVDPQGRPVAGAAVFNAGDGHSRVESLTGRDGTFELTSVPDGQVFLFAEKSGYRFTGMQLCAGDQDPRFVLALVDEPIEPISTLPPLLSNEEQAVLARQMLDRWIDDAVKSGDDVFQPLAALADLDPIEAYNRAEETESLRPTQRGLLERVVLYNCIERRALPWDELRPVIESMHDSSATSSLFTWAAGRMEKTANTVRREWLAAALRSARRVDDPAGRAGALAVVAAGLLDAGDEMRAVEIASEAEKIAEQLPPSENSGSVFYLLALCLAKRDPTSAAAWIENIKGNNSYVNDGALLAVELLPKYPAAAEEMWHRISDRVEADPRPLLTAGQCTHIADVCYGMASADITRAKRVAAEAKAEPLRLRALAAVALRLSETDPAGGRKLLERIIRGELPQAVSGDEFNPFAYFLAAPITAAWILPIAEQIDPQLGRECLWRSLALRPNRPRREKLDDEDAAVDVQLAIMLSRYDRSIGHALLALYIARLPELARCGSTSLNSRQALLVYAPASTEAAKILVAALHIDANWSAKLFDDVPEGESQSQRRFYAWIRNAWVTTLSRHAVWRWGRGGAFSPFAANYWTPKLKAESNASENGH